MPPSRAPNVPNASPEKTTPSSAYHVTIVSGQWTIGIRWNESTLPPRSSVEPSPTSTVPVPMP